MPNLFGPSQAQPQVTAGSPAPVAGPQINPQLAQQFQQSFKGQPTQAAPAQNNQHVDPGLIMSLFQALSRRKQ